MHIYRIQRQDGDERASFAGTLNEAHDDLKQLRDSSDARIELLDVDDSKDGILAILNGCERPWLKQDGPLRTWALTPRGGLREVANGE